MKIGDKFGQFYMVATMVIIVLIASFAIVINYSSQRIPPSFYYLGEEIEIESEKVIEYGLNNELDLNVLLENFTRTYSLNSDADNLYFVFGERESITLTGYQEFKSESILVDVGSGNQEVAFSEGIYKTETFENPNEVIILTAENIAYNITLNEGQNFYYIISKDINGEKYVTTNTLGIYSDAEPEGGEEEPEEELESGHRIIFLSSSQYKGDLGGLVGADLKCNNLAEDSNLEGTYMAWLSSSVVDARDRIPQGEGDLPYVRNDAQKTVIADNLNDLLDNTIDNPIRYNEKGVDEFSIDAWTGTDGDGTLYEAFLIGTCNSWTSSSFFNTARHGDSGKVNEGWTSDGIDDCNVHNRIYCIQIGE
ncbi:DUF1554 domain-containing protein [Candidatus Pacearchaeota archaeon]|nr:DUF1554 domain-containing protein [Candidatus Pacearchaeota archaeon]